MDETRNTWSTPQPSTPTEGLGEVPATPTMAAADDMDRLAQAQSQITELVRRFVDALRHDAQDAERIRQEAIKLRTDAEVEAARIVDGAHAEAKRVREETNTWAAEVVEHIERAEEGLAEAIGRFGARIRERMASEDAVVTSDAPGNASAQS